MDSYYREIFKHGVTKEALDLAFEAARMIADVYRTEAIHLPVPFGCEFGFYIDAPKRSINNR